MQGNTKVTAMIENDNCYKARIIKVKVIFRQPPPQKIKEVINLTSVIHGSKLEVIFIDCTAK